MKATLGHFEIPARDPKIAARFFHRVFGWRAEVLSWDGPEYLKLRMPDEEGPPAQGGILSAEAAGFQRPLPVIHLEGATLEECLDRVEAAGGVVEEPPRGVGAFGRFARFRDPEGHAWGLWTAES